MFIVTAGVGIALQRSAMYPCSSYIRLRWSRSMLGCVAIDIWSLRDPKQ